MRKLLLLIPLIFVACEERLEKKSSREFTVVPDMNHCMRDSTGNYIKFGCDYYLTHNLIVDQNSNVYYYTNDYNPGWSCDADVKRDYSKEPFINLKPYQLIVLPKSNIGEFYNSQIATNERTTFITVASERDTFKSIAIDSLYDKAISNNSNTFIIIRRLTEEEKVVLKYKKSGTPYYPSDIQWDTTKTKFLPKDREVLY